MSMVIKGETSMKTNRSLGANQSAEVGNSVSDEVRLLRDRSLTPSKSSERLIYTDQEKKQIVFCVGLIMILGAAVFVQTGPFFPLMAKSKGVDQSYVGYIFGTMATM